MIRNGTTQTRLGRDRTLEGRRVLDLAEGVLIGLRRCQTEAAFDELITVAHRHGLSVSAAASALVALATGDGDVAESNPAAALAAQREWSGLLAEQVRALVT